MKGVPKPQRHTLLPSKSQPKTGQHATNRRHRRTQRTQQLTRTSKPPLPICTSRRDSRVVQVLESVLSPIAQHFTRSEPPGLRGATNQPRDTLTQLRTHSLTQTKHVCTYTANGTYHGGMCTYTRDITVGWGRYTCLNTSWQMSIFRHLGFLRR